VQRGLLRRCDGEVVAVAGIVSPVLDSTFQFTDGMQIKIKIALVACWEGRKDVPVDGVKGDLNAGIDI